MERVRNFLFTNSTTRQTIVKNTLWLAGGTTLSKIIRSLVIIYAARILGTADYGIFTYALSLGALFTIFADVGISGLVTRELVKKDPETGRRYAATALLIKLGFLFIAGLLIAFIGPLIAKFPEAKPLMIIIAFILSFDSLRGFLYAITRAENRMERESAIEVVTEVFVTGLCIGALFMFPSPMSLALAYLIGGGIGCIIALFVFRTYFVGFLGRIDIQSIRSIIASALPFAVMGIFSVLMTNIDSVIIGIFNDAHVLGLYAAAQKPISILYLIPGFLYASIFPIMSKFVAENDTNRMTILVSKSMTFSLLFALPIIAGGILLAGPIINTVFGYDYIGAVVTFQLLLITLFFIFPGMTLSNALFAENKQKVFMKSSFAGALTNIVLDLLLIPPFGIAGSAIATIAAQAVMNGILYFEIKKLYRIRILSGLLKIIGATVLMSVVVYGMKYLSLPLLLIIPVGGVLYFGLLFLFREKLFRDIKLSLSQ